MFKILILVAILLCFYIGLRRFFIFWKIKKHKKHYFVTLSFGALFKIKFFSVCIAYKKNKDETLQIMLVGKKGKTRKIMNFSKVGRVDLDLIKTLLPAIQFVQTEAEFRIGLEIAKDTALLCGFLHTIINTILPVFAKYIQIENTKIKIIPQFKKIEMSYFLDCILKIDLANIIFRYFKYKRKKAVMKNASNREYYASNHE